MSGIGFSFGSSKSKSATTSTSSGSGTSVTDITRMDEASKWELDQLMQLMGDKVGAPSQEYSKAAAIGDVAGVVNNLFNQFREQALPQIFSAEGATGGYGSTSAQFMANDAFAETLGRAAQVSMENIGRYADISNKEQSLNLEGLIQALNLQKEAVAREATAESYTSKSSSKTKGKGSQMGIGASLTGGG